MINTSFVAFIAQLPDMDCQQAIASLRKQWLRHDIDEQENSQMYRAIEAVFGVEYTARCTDAIDAILYAALDEII